MCATNQYGHVPFTLVRRIFVVVLLYLGRLPYRSNVAYVVVAHATITTGKPAPKHAG